MPLTAAHTFGAGATFSIRLKMPRNGIATHFGRLLSSYRSSYQGFENQEASEQELQVISIFRDENGIGSLLQIGSQEYLARSRGPKVGIHFESGLVDRPNGPGFE